MSKQERARLSGIKKTVLITLSLLVIWQVVQNDKVTNALAGLFFGGVVPGTNKVLAPATVMYIAGGVAALVALLVTLHFVRRYKRLHPKADKQNLIASVAVEDEIAAKIPFVEVPIEEPAPVIEKTPVKVAAMPAELAVPALMAAAQEIDLEERRKERMRAQRQLMFAPFITSVSAMIRRVLTLVSVGSTKVGAALIYAGHQFARGLRLFFRYAIRYGKISYAFLIKTSIAARKNIIKASIAAWRRIVPYLWQFDRWLELRVRDIEAWSRKKADQHEDAKLIFDIARNSVKLMRQFVTKLVKKITPSPKEPEEFDE